MLTRSLTNSLNFIHIAGSDQLAPELQLSRSSSISEGNLKRIFHFFPFFPRFVKDAKVACRRRRRSNSTRYAFTSFFHIFSVKRITSLIHLTLRDRDIQKYPLILSLSHHLLISLQHSPHHLYHRCDATQRNDRARRICTLPTCDVLWG